MQVTVCTVCKVKKQNSEFRPSRNRRRTSCKNCENEYQKAYYRKHIEVTRKRKREWMANARIDPVKSERMRELRRKNWKTNRSKKQRDYIATMRSTNPFRYRARYFSTRNKTKVSEETLIALWKRQGGKCGLTGWPIDVHTAQIDHVIPVSRGGRHDIQNLRWVDARANRSKRELTDAEFFELCEAVCRTHGRMAETMAGLEEK